MSIALDTLGKTYLDWANRVHVSPEMLHRVAAIASGGLDVLPHNGAVITLLSITGLTHKESYYDIFMVCLSTASSPVRSVSSSTRLPVSLSRTVADQGGTRSRPGYPAGLRKTSQTRERHKHV
jgi:hypothetical protein